MRAQEAAERAAALGFDAVPGAADSHVIIRCCLCGPEDTPGALVLDLQDPADVRRRLCRVTSAERRPDLRPAALRLMDALSEKQQ